MRFEENTYYHIYNQGNDRQPIFFKKENYYFFLWKMRANLLPFGDIIAYCLMPNHYHWLMLVRRREVSRSIYFHHSTSIENERRLAIHGLEGYLPKTEKEVDSSKLTSLNMAIGTIQRTYTRAINLQEKRTGSLFRQKFKAKAITQDKNSTQDYSKSVIRYIHNNPVHAGLVIDPNEYLWSSARDYEGLRKNIMLNLDLGNSLLKED